MIKVVPLVHSSTKPHTSPDINIIKKFDQKIEANVKYCIKMFIPGKVYYILSSDEEYSWPSQVLCVMNIMPECQICS